MDNQEKRSSLPRSLIPHLYSGPVASQPRDSSTRSTLTPTLPAIVPPAESEPPAPIPSERILPPVIASVPSFEPLPSSSSSSPHSRYFMGESEHHTNVVSYSESSSSFGTPMHISRGSPGGSELTLPMPQPREYLAHRMSWSEGEAGPSSLLYVREPQLGPASWSEGETPQQTLLPAPQMSPPRREIELLNVPQERGGMMMGRGTSQPAMQQRYSARDEFYFRGEEEREQYPFGATQGGGMYGLPGSASRSLHHLPATPYHAGPSHPFVYEPYVHARISSEPMMGGPGGPSATPTTPGESESEAAAAKRKRRKATSDSPEQARRGHVARKTAVACNFCRGRKLRCNGAKPSCSNCIARKYNCEYVPIQRRRGPGKAPKRSRSKKGSASAAGTPDPLVGVSEGGRALEEGGSPSYADYELGSLAPELRPYTSVMTLESSSDDGTSGGE